MPISFRSLAMTLGPVDQRRLAEAVEIDDGRKTSRVARLSEKPAGFGRVVLVVLRALAELIDR